MVRLPARLIGECDRSLARRVGIGTARWRDALVLAGQFGEEAAFVDCGTLGTTFVQVG